MEERLARAREVVRAARALLRAGLVVGTWGNISVRLGSSFLITPSGVDYLRLRPEDLVLVGPAGEKEAGLLRPSTETPLHAAIYRARPDVGAVVHTHSPYACVCAVNREAIPPLLEEAAQLLGGAVEVAPYAPAGTEALAAAAVSALGEGKAVLLANHGVVGVGKDLREALLVCQVVEKSAFVYLWARASGSPRVLAPEEVAFLYCSFRESYGQKPAQEGGSQWRGS